ncbi:MAG: helix-turn-helix transcriptional regulator [Cyanobacteria bacterium Co-bin13]|nr:helix-turn-helix transcriptional regulator [Cyanobacteria bacterium Co-bin13]
MGRAGRVRLKIRELAEERGITIKEIADRAGVNYNTVKSYARLSAVNTADLSTLYKIAKAFDIAIEDLIELIEE